MSLVHKNIAGRSGRFNVIVGKTRLSDLSSEADIEIASSADRISKADPTTAYVDDSILERALAELLDEVRSSKPRSRQRKPD